LLHERGEEGTAATAAACLTAARSARLQAALLSFRLGE